MTTALATVPRPVRPRTLADGFAAGDLVDVSDTAHRAGFRWPVALSRACWLATVRGVKPAGEAREASRLWDLLWLVRLGMQRRHWHGEGFPAEARLAAGDGLPLVRLWVACPLRGRRCVVSVQGEG